MAADHDPTHTPTSKNHRSQDGRYVYKHKLSAKLEASLYYSIIDPTNTAYGHTIIDRIGIGLASLYQQHQLQTTYTLRSAKHNHEK